MEALRQKGNSVALAETLASLPWYDLREVRAANDALWDRVASELRARGVVHVPIGLDRSVHYETQWTSPRFLFGQACGYDVRIAHADRLQLVAVPCYTAPGCEGPTYRSFIVVREDSTYEQLEDLRGARSVVNSPTSHSGMNILRDMVAPLHEDGKFFGSIEVSGSHEASLAMLSRQRVDVAAIDCVTFALLERHRPAALSGLRVLVETEPHAAPPFVTGATTSEETVRLLQDALVVALRDRRLRDVFDSLLLGGIEMLPASAYQSIESAELRARQLGYGEMPGNSTRRAES